METTPIKKGKILGSILLIAGNCIGAGMLALPVLTGLGGLIPALCMFIVCWLFMTLTGLLLLEVNLSLHVGASLISMATRTLGRKGKFLSWVLWCFLFYCLLVAYIAGSGSLLTEVLQSIFHHSVPAAVGSTLFVALFGVIIYLGTHAVDHFNRYLMIGLIVSYLLLIGFGFGDLNTAFLLRREWKYMALMLPVLVISFGFHNIVPSLVPYLHGRVSLLKKVLFIGSAIPLVIYVAFELIVLGIVPAEEIKIALQNGWSSTEALQNTLENSWIGVVAGYFAFFALITSFLAISLSFVHFLADGLRVKMKGKRENVGLCMLVLIPPFIVALVDPRLFLTALNYAGGIGAVILFGVMPALMAWKCRYTFKETKNFLVPGGKAVLILLICFALTVLFLQIANEMGVIENVR